MSGLASVGRVVSCAIGAAVVVALLATTGCKTTDANQVGVSATFEFPFMGDYDVVNRTSFRWSDSFVTNNPAKYRHELAGPLACVAASTYGSRLFMDVRSLMDLAVPPERLVRCYEDTGLLTYAHPKYGRDLAGFTIGSRRCELPGTDFDVVFIAVRGSLGREDWLSNVNVANAWGSATQLDPAAMPKFHEGFQKSALFVMESFEQYVRDFGIDLKRAKILVTGHSRGAATANLIGKMLDDAADGPKTSPFADVRRENVFVYSIATPNVTIRPSPDTQDEKYRNIFSIVSPEDIVPRVPFKAWNGARYGRTLTLKSWSTVFWGGSYLHPGYVGMKNNFKDICGYEYWHMLWGTRLVDGLSAFGLRHSPTVGHFYYVNPSMRADGNTTSTHAILEMILWNHIPSSLDPSCHLSLMQTTACFAEACYGKESADTHAAGVRRERKRFPLQQGLGADEDDGFYPDGRDFSRQPGLTDVVWRTACMHAPATYIAWMKSGVDHGPDAIYENWDEFEE